MPLIRLSDPAVPRALRGPVLVDRDGRPRFWPAVDSFLHCGGLAASTTEERSSGIERLYAFSEAQHLSDPGLDALFAFGDLARLHDVLHAFFAMLRNEASRKGRSPIKAWRAAIAFSTGAMDRLLRSGALASGSAQELVASVARLSHHLTLGTRRRVQRVRGLPAGVVEDLYELISPDSPRNPFRTEAQRWRNFTIVMLLLHLGLRSGELLRLALDAIAEEFDPRIGQDRLWLNVLENPYGDDDPRSDTPSFKNSLATRQIPMSRPIAEIVDTYVHNFRGRRGGSFLVYSQRGKPLARRSLGTMFQVLSAHLSPGARRELWNRRRPVRVTAHDLRHTCAAVRLHQLVGDDQSRLPMAFQALRPFFGWATDSEMPQLYARSYFEHRLASVWRADFDSRVDFLRSLP